jgi:hypothetical protein
MPHFWTIWLKYGSGSTDLSPWPRRYSIVIFTTPIMGLVVVVSRGEQLTFNSNQRE